MSADRFGVPDAVTDGPLPDDFYALLGRIVVVDASIERIVTLFHQMVTNASRFTYIGDSNRNLIGETLKQLKQADVSRMVADDARKVENVLDDIQEFLNRAEDTLEDRNAHIHSAWLSGDFPPGSFLGLRYPLKDVNKGKPTAEQTPTLLQHRSRTIPDLRTELDKLLEIEELGRRAIELWKDSGIRTHRRNP